MFKHIKWHGLININDSLKKNKFKKVKQLKHNLKKNLVTFDTFSHFLLFELSFTVVLSVNFLFRMSLLFLNCPLGLGLG